MKISELQIAITTDVKFELYSVKIVSAKMEQLIVTESIRGRVLMKW